jgi:hypothetical protein
MGPTTNRENKTGVQNIDISAIDRIVVIETMQKIFRILFKNNKRNRSASQKNYLYLNYINVN